jgi:hypothetical protein
MAKESFFPLFLEISIARNLDFFLLQNPEIYENFDIQLAFLDSPHQKISACFERCTFDILGLKGPSTMTKLSVENPSNNLVTKSHQRVITLNFKRNKEHDDDDDDDSTSIKQRAEQWIPIGHATECPASTFYQEAYRKKLNLPKSIRSLTHSFDFRLR